MLGPVRIARWALLVVLAGGRAPAELSRDWSAIGNELGLVQADLVDAAALTTDADPAAASAKLDDAASRLVALVAADPSLARGLARASARVARARELLAAAAPQDDAGPAVHVLREASGSLRRLLERAARRAAACTLTEAGIRGAAIHRPGHRGVFRVRSSSGTIEPVLSVTNDDAARVAVRPEVIALGRGRFRVVWGDDAGAATLTATCGEGQATLRVFSTGPRGVLAASPPAPPVYATPLLAARVGSSFGPASPVVAGDGPLVFTAVPDLPAGLVLDPATGTISGTPEAAGPAVTVRVSARNVRTSASSDVTLDVDPALPSLVVDLAAGFAIEAVAEDSSIPVKMACAPDGTVFVSELTTGRIRRIDPSGALATDPVLAPSVLLGPEQGIFGLAVAPDFVTSGQLYFVASAPAEGAHADRNRLLRTTVTGGVGSDPVVLVDDLPLGATQNGGHLIFGVDGMLYLSSGDTGDPLLAQTDGSLAGRILRIAPDGSVPPDNPIPGSYEWCRGFRNPFGLTVDPASGYVFATENGPVADDELDLVQRGKNFEWGAGPDDSFGALTGIRVTAWMPVIVPTGIACHSGAQFGAPYAGNLFLGCYDLAQVRRLVLEGVDLRQESVFVQFDEHGIEQKPLDVVLAPDGSLLVATFSTIWRIRRD
jgi:glucose/arabinose dehydrogenase